MQIGLTKAASKPFLLQMDLQKGKGRPGLPSLKLGAAPAQGQVLFSSHMVLGDGIIEKFDTFI